MRSRCRSAGAIGASSAPWGHVPVQSLWATNWLTSGMLSVGGSQSAERCTLRRTSCRADREDPSTCQRNGEVQSPWISTGPTCRNRAWRGACLRRPGDTPHPGARSARWNPHKPVPGSAGSWGDRSPPRRCSPGPCTSRAESRDVGRGVGSHTTRPRWDVVGVVQATALDDHCPIVVSNPQRCPGETSHAGWSAREAEGGLVACE